jgi:hypothetical protein
MHRRPTFYLGPKAQALVVGTAQSCLGFVRASLIVVTGARGGILNCHCHTVRPDLIAHALQDILGGFVRYLKAFPATRRALALQAGAGPTD